MVITMSEPSRGRPMSWEHLVLWKDGQIDLDATRAGFPVNDETAVRVVLNEVPGWIYYVPSQRGEGRWHFWDGRCKAADESGRVSQWLIWYATRARDALAECKRLVAARAAAGLAPGTPQATIDQQTALALQPWEGAIKYHAGLLRTTGLNSLTSYLGKLAAKAESELDDRHPEWLNTASCTVNLRTGEWHLHDPADEITYCLDVAWVPGAPRPWFEHLVGEACGWNPAVISYLQRVLGYCLIGDNREQKIFFLAGDTASGKSQLLDAIGIVLGALHHRSKNELISVVRNGRNARVEYSCRGARLVTVTETGGHNRTDVAQVKRLTGERWISVDKHYATNDLMIPVTFTICQATNEMQTLPDFDDAMGRRVEVLPMGERIPEERRVPKLGEKIAEREAEGILDWLITGAMAYFRDGLHAPAEVLAETAKYRQSQNTFEDWVGDCCLLTPAGFTPNGGGPRGIYRPAAWESYKLHAAGGPRLSRPQFYEQLAKHPGVTWNEGSRRFEGIVLLDQMREQADER
jgi:P4 family phage/plasmid primase-like protien